eukprot:CAMPEP_0206235294 /NCGR_PEP_ID=MMETSP0047_2-20121206/13070_1 /ASSEMBLY_ACC=CAM_ASM_000192 /TAXON_ID=195065 /ORGANISM="Chroomonas mesostigmatica_cf, Strain CCMP1168" /LENGTH=173 /DNA_ID=CAMNT_0053659483 /DNA_START=576 /DNA_END=1095 /DNA_ORIENTATION=+
MSPEGISVALPLQYVPPVNLHGQGGGLREVAGGEPQEVAQLTDEPLQLRLGEALSKGHRLGADSNREAAHGASVNVALCNDLTVINVLAVFDLPLDLLPKCENTDGDAVLADADGLTAAALMTVFLASPPPASQKGKEKAAKRRGAPPVSAVAVHIPIPAVHATVNAPLATVS